MKNFTNLKSLLSRMAWNLHVIERRFSSTDRLSGSWVEGSSTLEEQRGNHAEITRLSPRNHPLLDAIWKHVAMIFAVLVMSIANIGTAWGTEYTFINQSTGKYTGDFYTGRAESNVKSSSKTIQDRTMTYYLNALGSTGAPGVPNTDRYIQYDVKTTATTITVYAYNSNGSSARTVNVGEFKEGKGSGETIRTKSIAKSSGDTIKYSTTNTTNSTIYITVSSSSSDVLFYQVVATESGESIASGASVGYTLDLNKGRLAVKSGETAKIDGITIVPSGDYTAASTTAVKIKTASTNYVSFTPSANCKLDVTVSSSKTYYINTTLGGSTGTAYTSSCSDVALTGGTTYYINPAGNEVTITKLEFKAAVAKDYTVTAATSTGTDTYGTVSAEASSLDASETTTITATPAAGYQVSNWAVSGTGASISPSGASNSNTTTLTMGSANATVTVTFEKVYASGTYNFVNQGDGSVTWGSSHTVMLPAGTKTTVPAGSRVDNIFFSTALDIEYEKGAEEGTGYKGWKIKQSGKLAFYVENDCDVIVTNGIINGMKIHYYNQSNVETNTNLTSTAGTREETAHVKGGTLFEIVSTTTSTNTLKGIRVSSSCTAPNHVDISGNWDYFGGETISLTATPYSSAGTGSPITSGITGYQWQKLISSTWTDVEDGTDEGTTISGATTANLQIAGCTGEHSGKYRCTISTGATCSTSSATATDGTEGFQVKVFTLECYTGGTTVYHFTRIGETQTGSTTITLAASTGYQFKFHIDGTYYGNSGTINEDVSNWVCTSGAGNLTVNSGLGGTFTITMDYSDGGSSSTVGEPEISVTYPRKTIYLNAGGSDLWDKDNAKFGIYYFRKESETLYGHAWTDIMPAYACGSGIYVTEIPQWNGVKIDAVRLNPSATNDNKSDWWDDYKYNQTNDCPVTSNDYITITGWNESDYTYTTYDAPEYTISFDGNGETSGSMTDVEDIECDASVTLEANAFVKTGYTFTGWKDGSSNDYADEATISNITADIALTAQWSAKQCTVSFNTNGGSGTITSVTATYDAAMPSKAGNLPTKEGYDFGGFWDGEGGTGNQYYKADGTSYANWDKNTTETTTLYAKWTEHVYTVTLDLEGGSGTTSVTATYNTTLSGDALFDAPTLSGYTFGGFYTSEAGGGSQLINANRKWNSSKSGYIDSDKKWIYTDDITLKAKWTQTVTLDDNGGSADGSADVVLKATSASTPSAPTYAGHTVVGYYADDGGANLVMSTAGALSNYTGYVSGGKWVHSGATTLYAHWKCNTPTISFASATNTVTITIPNGTKVYYTTNGDTPDDDDTEYTEAFTIDADCTVKAIAIQSGCTSSDVASEDLTYTDTKAYVTYAAGVTLTSGSVPSDATGYTPGAKVTVLGNTGSMVYTGYTFRGWTSGDYFYKAGDKFTISENTTLTAVWDDGSGETCTEYEVLLSEATQEASTAPKGQYITGKGKVMRKPDGSDATALGTLTLAKSCNGSNKGFKTGSQVFAAQTYNAINKFTFYGWSSSARTINGVYTSSSYSDYGDDIKSTCTITNNIIKDNCGSATIEFPSTLPANTYIKISLSGNIDSITSVLFENCVKTNYYVAFANQTGFGGSTTLPDTIKGVPSGKKIVPPSDPTASGYTFVGWYKEAACTNEWDFESDVVTADVTLYAKWCTVAHDVTWVVNGTEYTTGDPTTSTTDCDGIETMPTAPSALTCSDSFRGWSETNIYGEAVDTPPADLFTDAAGAPTINENKTFYAVFATQDDPDDDRTAEQMKENSFTSVFTSKAWADAGSLWTSGADGYQMSSGHGVNVTEATTGAYATTKSSYKGVKEVIVTYSTNASSGVGDITIEVGSTAMSGSAAVTKTGGTTDRTITYTPASADFLDGNVKITVTCTTNSLYIKSVQVIYSGYHDYRCICPSLSVTPKLVTASTPIFITSAASKTVRSQDSLQIVGSGLKKNATLSISSPASEFVLKSRTGGDLTTSATGTINAVGYIYYTPGVGDTDDGLDKNNSFTITDGINSETVSTALIGRHLPANFVIAAKNGDNWYALPADMGQGDAASSRAPVEITVDNSTTPTSATTSEANVYSLIDVPEAVQNRDSGEYVILWMHGKNKPLFGNQSTAPVGSSTKSVIANLDKDYWWALTQKTTSITNAADATYNISVANGNTNNPLKIWLNAGGTGVPYWGLYQYGTITELRLIPWNEVYTLTWNTNGGSDLSCTGICTSGLLAPGTDIVAPTDPTLSNYTFDGWKTADDGTGDAAADEMPDEDVTYYAAWKQTVTLRTGAQGSGADKTPVVYLNGTSVGSFTPHSVSGYTLQGYYTAASAGTKVLNANGTFAAENVTGYITSGKWSNTGSAPMLYAQWRAAAGKTCYEWDAAETTPETGTNNYGGLYLTASTVANNQKVSSTLTDTVFNVSDNGKSLKGHINGAVIDSLIFSASTSSSDNTTFVVSFCSTQTFDTAKIIKVGGYHCTVYNVPVNTADCTQIKIKAPTGTKSFVLSRNFMSDKLTSSASLSNSGKRYLYYIKACSASGGTHTISYANGGGTGTIDDQTGIEDDGSQELADAADLTAPTNFAFAGWVADVDVTIGGSTVTAGTLIADGATITNITSDIALTAVWSQTITLDDNDANHGATGDGSATVYYNATSLASISHTTAASGYKLAGYYTAATSGTKVLNSDGSFAGTDITDYIADGKWVQNDDDEPLLYAQYEVAGSIKWNLQVNSADAPIVTSSKNSSYTQISTSNMTNLDSIGLNITASKKASMTSKISAPTAFDKDKYMKVTFQVASGYQFKPSSIKVPIQPVSGGADVKLVLVDNAATPDSIGKEQSSLSKGTLTTVEMTNSSAVFKGTVTLKIYCYGSSTGTYRLGTPIQIDGEIESTCTMPSYESVSYSQTEYIKDASASAISVEGASGDPSYQWKYNSTGDRTSGTNCGTEASVTPSTESTGTLYYWCELTNACGTVKTPAVAITVSASKSTATVTWTDPSTPNYGGGGYTIKATVNETGWDGNASDLIITAPAGIRIYDKTSGTDGSGKKYVQVKFDVQTAFDRETYSSNIPFTVSADATTSYNAISADHNVSYSACSGGGGSATEELMAVDASHIDNSTWKGGWVYDGIGMMRYGHGSSDISAGTKDANLNDLSYTMASGDITKYYKSASNHFGFYTEKAITGIRLYVYTSNDNVTVSGVYVGNSAYTSGTPSSGAVSFEAEYNDENDALRSGTHSGSAWVDITFDKEVAAEKYGQINLSNNVKIAGMAFISASGSGATLPTTLAFATTGTIAKTQSAANFTNAASVTAYSETLGAITYSSSNTDCATVDSKTGEVTITASGAEDLSTTITATLAASGCYKGATTTYTITVAGVSCTVNHGTLASDVTTKCSTADATLTLTGFESGATVQWYKGETTISTGGDYTITTDGTTSTLVTAVAGTYSVLVTNSAGTCSDRSNSITISNYSAEVAATKIVDKWYIKHGRVTPDIALWALDEGTHLSSVAWSPSNATGLTAADDFYESDGIVYLKGTEPSSNESSDVEYTLTLTVKDECENTTALSTSDKQITLTHQKNTDKHVLAFVVTGTEKGGWTAGISADQTTGVDLYNEIAKNFDVQATNIYSTDDEQKLKEYYSQFDILCITDYPNTKTTGTNSKSYVDAIGALVDIRPILTMEAWVSGLTNWKSKGISGTPKSPTTRQYSMLLQCKDHEIFSGTNPTTVGSGDETMYRIDMVDKTQEEYVTLDATYGAGAHESDKNYQYGKKPALQGFTYDASMSSLLPIGRIDDGEGNDLEVGVERQAVMEARLLVLGINGYAMERLDDDGLTIVINALKYLMKKNAEDIADCSNYFVGGAEGDETNWKNPDNWSGSTLPDRTQEVRIVAPCVISDTIARANRVKIVSGGTYSHGSKTANGSLTINPTGSLIVDGKIYSVTAPKYFEQRATEPEDLVVKADADHTGTLIFDNEDGETQATIEMYSPSHWEIVDGKYVKYWSYVGMPIKDVHIPDYFYGAFTYYFNEAKGWEKRFDNDIMQPFEGIGLSMQEGHKETFYGTMVSTENTDITITNHTGYGDGDNLIGNSWTAPIQIANFDAEDFGTCWATVYIFNTGKGGNTYVNATAGNDGAAKAGQWLGVPIGIASLPKEDYTGLRVIPAMNAFLVHDTVSTSTTLHLDYDKLVRGDAILKNDSINQKMRAPKKDGHKKKDVEGLMRIRVVGEKTNTDVWMLQDPRFREGFDNGWEAYYSTCDDRSAQLYARSAIGAMSFLALPDLDGTVLGFAPSRDGNNYTFTFKYRGEDEYYLNDLKLQQSVLIDADNTYAFTYEKGDTNRFYVSRTPLQAPQTPTGIGNTEGTSTQSTKAIKVIYNDKLYIIRGGRVYSADGMLVK